MRHSTKHMHKAAGGAKATLAAVVAARSQPYRPMLNGEAAAARDALGALLRGDAPPLLPGSEDDARTVVEALSRTDP